MSNTSGGVLKRDWTGYWPRLKTLKAEYRPQYSTIQRFKDNLIRLRL